MPKYYFHIKDGILIADEVGVALPGLGEAQREAMRRAGDVLAFEGDQFWHGDVWQVIVTDDTGTVLFNLSFSATAFDA